MQPCRWGLHQVQLTLRREIIHTTTERGREHAVFPSFPHCDVSPYVVTSDGVTSCRTSAPRRKVDSQWPSFPSFSISLKAPIEFEVRDEAWTTKAFHCHNSHESSLANGYRLCVPNSDRSCYVSGDGRAIRVFYLKVRPVVTALRNLWDAVFLP